MMTAVAARRTPSIVRVAAVVVAICVTPGLGVLAQDAEEQAKQHVVMIHAKLGGNDVVGAGLIVGSASDRVYIVTANHVVRQGRDVATYLRVQFRWLPGEQVEANLLSDADPALDVAVLSVSNLRRVAFPQLAFDLLGDGAALKRSDPVFTIGYPDARAWYTRVTPDHVAGISVDGIKFESMFVTQGHSGGALVNDRWLLVGLVRADQPPEGVAVPIERLLERLRQWNYPVQLIRRDARTVGGPGHDPPPVLPTTPKEPVAPPRIKEMVLNFTAAPVHVAAGGHPAQLRAR